MKRGRKSKEITIKSNETRIVFGILVALLGIGLVLSPFIGSKQSGNLFNFISNTFGYSSIVWGVTVIYLSLRFLSSKSAFKSYKFLFGLIILSIATSTFLTFWVPKDVLIVKKNFAESGGLIGFTVHNFFDGVFGQLLEFFIIMLIFLIGFSLTSAIKIETVKNFFAAIFRGIGRIFAKKDGTEIIENMPASANTTEKQLEYIKNNPQINVNTGHSSNMAGSPAQTSLVNTATGQTEIVRKDPQFIDNSTASATSETENIFEQPQYANWKNPPMSLLKEPVYKPQNPEIHKRNASIIERTLQSFGVQSKVDNISIGPTVVQYALSITVGTKVAKVRNLANDLALALATNSSSVRIEAPIPGTSLIGIEIPNPTPNFVFEKELLKQLEVSKGKYELPLIMGKSVAGLNIIKDLTELPHLLVAGATGTGKSVGINSMLIGLLMTKSPDELRLILVDPKMVEMSPYNGIPHLLTPVITDMELVINALQWATEEMLRRYRILKQAGLRKIKEYNQKMGYSAMPYIVVVIDEMADLMLTTGVDVESKIVRLTQMSRAVGIHLILATQRPSVDVITGLIKANVPGRMSFAVSTSIDSRVIIDQTGSETLIGKGDMLFKSPEYPRPIRMQGAWTDIKDIENVIGFIKEQTDEVHYFDEVTKPKVEEVADEGGDDFSEDALFEDALSVVINAQKASASLLQRKLRIGYNRAARLMDELEESGAIGQQDGSSPRKVLVVASEQILGKKTGTAAENGMISSPDEISDKDIYEGNEKE